MLSTVERLIPGRENRLTGACRVTCGPNDSYFPNLVGKPVGSVRRCLATVFNIPENAEPYVTGSVVGPDYRLRAGDSVEFLVRRGQKRSIQPAAADKLDAILEALLRISGRVDALEKAVSLLVSQRTIKDWYTTKDLATMLGRAEYTVREWCRLGRIKAKKVVCVRGGEQEWRVSHEELLRYHDEGLLPVNRKY